MHYHASGTVIRLQSGQLKRVEEMSTEDFVLSAAMKTDLILCNSTVVRIQEIEQTRQVLVTFAVGEQATQVKLSFLLLSISFLMLESFEK
ncbi:unnamed protein product [Gongylonema pulchrum]|uniref:AXH domain-containing protein n=1 Tax=Gongylonema pulchrum TaxID=637853 RepID=A0A183DBX2_9BILA|nr:unnamed protein product [Gongylonema pulchrum]